MEVTKLFLTKNDCYKKGGTHKVRGIMVHSTGANNPTLKRYVGPDDGKLGKNQYNNHWNQARPDGQSKCVHAFIGKLENGKVATYQTLPWTMPGWHSGVGSKGSRNNANNTGYVGFEICEDNLQDRDYFNAVYAEAVDLCVYLCKEYGLTEKNIIDHSEGHKLGIASNHGDVRHWFSRHGKSMDTFRSEVGKRLRGGLTMGQYKELKEENRLLKEELAEIKKQLNNKANISVDGPVADWAKVFYDWGVAKSVTDGSNPRGVLTREQGLTMLYRLPLLNDTGRNMCREIIKKAVAVGTFQKSHLEKLDTYMDADLISYALTYVYNKL